CQCSKIFRHRNSPRPCGYDEACLNAPPGASGREIDAAFTRMEREQVDALFVAPGTFFNTRRVQLAILAARHALPAIYSLRAYPASIAHSRSSRVANKSVANGSKRTSRGHSLPLPGVLHCARTLA